MFVLQVATTIMCFVFVLAFNLKDYNPTTTMKLVLALLLTFSALAHVDAGSLSLTLFCEDGSSVKIPGDYIDKWIVMDVRRCIVPSHE